jgi:hypothetical protein
MLDVYFFASVYFDIWSAKILFIYFFRNRARRHTNSDDFSYVFFASVHFDIWSAKILFIYFFAAARFDK